MTMTLPAFSPAESSLWLTQCGRALDSRLPNPLLGDTTADEIVIKTGYDLARFPLPKSKIIDIAARAKKLDDIVTAFVATHPDAVVLDLGAGLDSRASRVDPPATVRWYDIDLPTVVSVREQVVPVRPGVRSLAADLKDHGWLGDLPRDRPAVIVADGLMPFLTAEGFASLLRRLVDHFPAGEIAFNGYPKLAVWVVKHFPKQFGSIAPDVVNPGSDDPHDPERWAPGLTLVEESYPTRDADLGQLSPATRLIGRAMTGLLSINPRRLRSVSTVVDRYRFGEPGTEA
ncbi:class I SAM-dependent methyltransferase [Microlunatus parietis]|uniref:O-methyltransferase involved in polyketide biosynthesis n=1 Tax=Microlunatus parietis TaxID=682979 RepID=A0A7Y9I678_9ACTN|nr:class I SAM-dependent methyltransferase [Microlunatus parietis]NYE71043.1 O-methyltransferase involved in polyketide biosynthesis [Microlunatus parietis]